MGARARNIGWRIDYVLASPAAMRFVRGAFIEPRRARLRPRPVGVDLDAGITAYDATCAVAPHAPARLRSGAPAASQNASARPIRPTASSASAAGSGTAAEHEDAVVRERAAAGARVVVGGEGAERAVEAHAQRRLVALPRSPAGSIVVGAAR